MQDVLRRVEYCQERQCLVVSCTVRRKSGALAEIGCATSCPPDPAGALDLHQCRGKRKGGACVRVGEGEEGREGGRTEGVGG